MKQLYKPFIFSWFLILTFLFEGALAQTKMELKKPKIPEKKEENKPVFELLNLSTPRVQKESNSTRWGNNPFFQQQPEVEKPKPVENKPEPQGLVLFEYKVSAIWKIKNEYKALISGHIVKTGDKLNELKVTKITPQSITVQRKNKQKTFKIGILFYDFQI